jgi:antitoxin PrlF
MRATIAERGQVTIPKDLRIQLGLKPGTVLDFEIDHGKLIAFKSEPVDPVQAVMGCLGIGKHTDDAMKQIRGEL